MEEFPGVVFKENVMIWPVLLLEVCIGIAMGVFFSLWVTVPVMLLLGLALVVSLHDRGGIIVWMFLAPPLVSLLITTLVVRYAAIWSILSLAWKGAAPHLFR